MGGFPIYNLWLTILGVSISDLFGTSSQLKLCCECFMVGSFNDGISTSYPARLEDITTEPRHRRQDRRIGDFTHSITHPQH
jgi:hypothetical protein